MSNPQIEKLDTEINVLIKDTIILNRIKEIRANKKKSPQELDVLRLFEEISNKIELTVVDKKYWIKLAKNERSVARTAANNKKLADIAQKKHTTYKQKIENKKSHLKYIWGDGIIKEFLDNEEFAEYILPILKTRITAKDYEAAQDLTVFDEQS